MSQLLERLNSAIQQSTDPSHRAELTARSAAYLARIGEFDACQARIAEVRGSFGQGQDGRVTVWIMLAEALLVLYSELSPTALDRLARGQLLATAARYQPGIAVLSAWKAHVEFEMAKYDAMFRSLETAIANVVPADVDARTRIAIVISNLCMLVGDDVAANGWFKRGRDLAIPNGDQASIEALLYNRVAFRFGELRTQYCLESVEGKEFHALRKELESAENLQELIRIGALTNHIRLASARLDMFAGDYMEAMNRLQEVRVERPFAEHNFDQHFIDLEVSYCQCGIGDIECALTTFACVDSSKFDVLDLDDRLVAAWIKKALCEKDNRFGAFDAADAEWRRLGVEYREFRGDLDVRLKALLDRSSGFA